MLDYLVTNVVISVCVLASVWLLRQAPAKIGFHLLCIGLLCWFVPWQMLPNTWLAAYDTQAVFWLDTITMQTPLPIPVVSVVSYTPESTSWMQYVTWGHLFALLCGCGCALFAWRVFSYLRFINRLQQHTISQQYMAGVVYPINVVPLFTPAIATGIFKPTIWVDSQLLQREELSSVLLHESTHIKQGDVLWLWMICLMESVFWWNPLCRLMAHKARQHLELRCDEQCFSVRQQQYQLDLASLLLRPLSLSWSLRAVNVEVLNMLNSSDFSVYRVKMLNKEKVMKRQHLAVVVAALSIGIVAASAIASSGTEAMPDKVTANAMHFSAEFETQQSALLKAAVNAKSTQSAELMQVVTNIQNWQKNRMPLIGREESVLKLQAFSLLAHVQHKLGLYQEVMTAFATWYPKGSQVPFFLRNITALSYLQMNQPDLALQELSILQDEIGDGIRPGSVQLLAKVYIHKGDYAQALTVLDHPNVQDHTTTNTLKYYIYTQQKNDVQIEKIKKLLPQSVANNPAELPDIGVPGSPLLVKL